MCIRDRPQAQRVRSEHSAGMLLTCSLRVSHIPSFDPAAFTHALAQQLGLPRGRLEMQSWRELRAVDPRDPNAELLCTASEGRDPTLSTVSRAVQHAVQRSHSQHRHIAGHPVLSIQEQLLDPSQEDPRAALASLMHRLRSRLFRDRIRLREFLRVHDRLHCNRIAKAKFRTGLSSAKVSLSEKEMSMLEAEFEAEGRPAEILYSELCDALECVFAERDGTLEADPMQRARSFVPCGQRWDQHEGVMELGALDKRETRVLYETCQRVARVCSRRRMALECYMREKDARRWGLIERSEFRAVLNMLELEVDQQELDVLYKRFAVPGPELNYKDFVQHVRDLGNKPQGFMGQPVTAFGENQ
eukprot:TRINITY_DN50242_c0_g1_i1.p1 TRINITY_DN50242_c0_g1~~TRINITY_DN50242_c0_g1_i1.p1  ORF type:complete len:359 (-),score=127.60 TRINITY_DN50242_c0_g1_i1:255-1331(-)